MDQRHGIATILETGVSAADLWNIGRAYCHSKGEETDFTRLMRAEMMPRWLAAMPPISDAIVDPSPVDSVVDVSEDAKVMAIASIKQYPEIIEATIIQRDRGLSLVLVVSDATTEHYAKHLGNNFVRMVKTFSGDNPPGPEIGVGIYDYLVEVYHPGEVVVVEGSKIRTEDRITW